MDRRFDVPIERADRYEKTEQKSLGELGSLLRPAEVPSNPTGGQEGGSSSQGGTSESGSVVTK